ncbi:MAG: SelB C-terminal domain-containing protein, partial [Planctomycetales bacterium]|nr:SelB C-terminal domain-containing protein [Planctomycetales bacterium]
LRDYHRDHPDRSGIPLDELRTRVRPDADPALFGAVVAALVQRGRLRREGHVVGRAEFRPRRDADQVALDSQLLTLLRTHGLAPPRASSLAAELAGDATQREVDRALERLVSAGHCVRVDKSLVFAGQVLADFESEVRAFLEAHEWIDLQALKQIAGVSRKWLVPLSEWLDRARVTVRVGDRRRLRHGTGSNSRPNLQSD